MNESKESQARPEAVLRVPDLDFVKSAVLNTLRSAESKRSYRFAIDYFGTCYRAANRIHVGQTAGRGRMDREYTAHGQAVKDIYVYPLVRAAGQRFCGR